MKRNWFPQVLASIMVNSIYALKSYPALLINSMLGPLSILAIITFATQGKLLGIGILGAFIANLVSGGVFLQADMSHFKNDLKLQDMLVSSPTTQFTYIFGMAVSELIFSLPTLFILFILAVLFLHISLLSVFVIAAAILLIFVLSTALGFMFSTFTSDIVQGWGFAGIVSTLLSTLPPVFYPITYLPKPYVYIAYLSPTTYAAEIAQSAAGFIKISGVNLLLDWIVLVVMSITIIYVAIKKSKWRAD